MSPLDLGSDPGVVNARVGEPQRLLYVWRCVSFADVMDADKHNSPRDVFHVVTIEDDIAEAVRLAKEAAAGTALPDVVSVQLVAPAWADGVDSVGG